MKLIGINSKKKEDYELFLQENPAIEGERLIIAKVLCLFLGFCGAHSFYLGDKKRGISSLILFIFAVLMRDSIIEGWCILCIVFSVAFDLHLLMIGEYRERNPKNDPIALEIGEKDELIYLLLALFFTPLGAQNFYLGYTKRASFALVLSILTYLMDWLPLLLLWKAVMASFYAYSVFERRSADGKYIQQSGSACMKFIRIFILLCSISVLLGL